MQHKMTKILEEGGVVEISVKLKKHEDIDIIECKLVNILSGYCEENENGQLSAEQENFIEHLLKEKKERIGR